jgi:putative transposase
MSRNYKFHHPENAYFVTLTIVNWIDVFTRILYREILIDSLKHCIKHKALQIYAWVIMSNHVHMIISTTDKTLPEIMRDLKRHTSKALLQAITDNTQESRKEWMLWHFKRAGQYNPNNKDYQLWQQGNHPIELYGNEVMQQKLDYIHYNPVTTGWVDEPHHYLYSSARDYASGKGLIDVILMI